MRYVLKPLATDNYEIRRGRTRAGFVRRITSGEKAGQCVARIGDEIVFGPDPKAAFREIVTVANRIALCGENDHAKAVAALDARNAATARENARIAEQMEPINAVIRETAAALNIPLRPRRRARGRRILV